MAELIGRRVNSVEELERAGDYCGPTRTLDQAGNVLGRGVWFLLPIHEGKTRFDRPTRGSGLHRVNEPPWTFRECADGSIEIRASIACGRGEKDKDGNELSEYWHGYLNEGHRWSW